MKRLLLVDGNNYGFAGMANPKLSAGDKDTQAILSVLKRMRGLFDEHREAFIVVLWDGRSWRKDFYTEYKANRKKTEKQVEAVSAYKEQKKDIMLGLKLLGVSQCSADNMEADDLAYILTTKARLKGTPVTLLTADHDWQQIVQPGVEWINLIHDQQCRFPSFERDTGYRDPKRFVEAKCVLGDAGDNIKGVHGVGPKSLEGIYTAFETFDEFLESLRYSPAVTNERYLASYGKNMLKSVRELDVAVARETIKRNLTLMDLGTTDRPTPVNLKNTRRPLEREGFELFCHQNAFRSILRDFDEFVRPFEENINVIRQA